MKSFKEFILETPFVDKNLEKETYDKHKIDDVYLKNNERVIWNKENEEEGVKHRIGMTHNE